MRVAAQRGALPRRIYICSYMQCPGLVARCAVCGDVLLRLANADQRMFLDVRGMTYLSLGTSGIQESV